jgi:hypothetical protein
VWYLAHHQGHVVAENRGIKPRDIQGLERTIYHHENVSYKQAWRAKEQVIEDLDGPEDNCFSQFPDYIARFTAATPKNYAALHPSIDGKFKAAFFSPAPCRHAFDSIREIVFLDGTHTFGRYKMILLIAVGIDANGHVIPLAYSLVPVEDEYWWIWFLQQLALALEDLTKSNKRQVIMSDRQKGLINAVATALPYATQAHCCNHICANVEVKYGKALRQLFWKCVYADSKEKFKKALQAIQEVNSPAAKYIDDIPHALWTTYAFPISRFGHVTSNCAESLNATWKPLRQLPPLAMVDAIYQWILKEWRPRHLQNCQFTRFADVPYILFQENLKVSRKYQAHAVNSNIYQVEIPNTPARWEINFKGFKCSCGKWIDLQIPCAHAIRAILTAGQDPLDEQFFSVLYTIQALRYTYSYPVRPVLIENLVKDDSIQPPEFQKQAGRPRTKRIRRKPHSRDTRVMTCSACGEQGHNRATCSNRPKERRGRGQMYQDIEDELTIGLDPSSEGSEVLLDNDNDDEGNIDSDSEVQQALYEGSNTIISLENDDEEDPFGSFTFGHSSVTPIVATPISPIQPTALPRTPSPRPTRRRRRSEITVSPYTPQTQPIILAIRPSPRPNSRPKRQVKRAKTLLQELEEVAEKGTKKGAKKSRK